MEQDILNRINRLKQDLTSVSSHNPKKSEDLAAYLSQSYRKPQSPEELSTSTPHVKIILEEKQARINELEEEVTYLKESGKNKEIEMAAKYERAIESIRDNCNRIVEYYEKEFAKRGRLENTDIEGIVESVQLLEQENRKLKSELKSQKSEMKFLENRGKDLESSSEKEKNTGDLLEIEELKGMKNKLEMEIANLERNKSEFVNSILEEYDEKFEKTIQYGKVWKSTADHLALEVFTALRGLKIEIFEIKNEILSNFEDAMTHASSIVTRVFKKYKIVSIQ